MSRGRILIVDDEAHARSALRSLLRAEGYETVSSADPLKALAQIDDFDPEVILTDVRMPAMNGIRFMERVRETRPETVFVVMTGFASIDSAVEAVKRGAEHYLSKPLDTAALFAVVERAMDKARLLAEMKRLRGQMEGAAGSRPILGDHPSMEEVRQTIARVAPTNATVLVSGETGTGKELVATAIHEQSPRVRGPFVKLSCATLAESVLESELFGHERGAFTGAVARREGRFMQANGGTLYLDEVSEIPLGTQVKLLRVLQEREFERVGGNETLSVDVRLVAATNRDLLEAIGARRFREDLFYRLNVVHIEVPPLRARRSDIQGLALAFVTRFAEEHGKPVEGLEPEVVDALVGYDWPGNVRELENAVERAVVMAPLRTIGLDDLPTSLRKQGGAASEVRIPGSTLAEIEREAILKSLEAVGGSTSLAAAMLGISPRKIQYRLNEYGLESFADHRREAREPGSDD